MQRMACSRGSNDRIAVVIPTYNGGRHIAEALGSVLNQTLPADEIVVIDDGSTDNTAILARSFPGVRVIVQSNSGVSASRNCGVRETTAGWIAFLDHDDVWEPTKLERQMATLRANPQADLCLCGQRTWFQIGDPSTHFLGDPKPRPVSAAVGRRLYWSFRFPPSCVLMSRESFVAVGGFDSSSQPCEDWDLWLRLEQHGIQFVCSPEVGLHYRAHNANVSNNGRTTYESGLYVYDRVIRPRRSWVMNVLGRQFMKGKLLADVAIVEREQNRPHLSIMLRSIVGFPFGAWRRYKIALHMIFTAVCGGRARHAAVKNESHVTSNT